MTGPMRRRPESWVSLCQLAVFVGGVSGVLIGIMIHVTGVW